VGFTPNRYRLSGGFNRTLSASPLTTPSELERGHSGLRMGLANSIVLKALHLPLYGAGTENIARLGPLSEFALRGHLFAQGDQQGKEIRNKMYNS